MKRIISFSIVILLLTLYLVKYGVFFSGYIIFLESLFSGSITGNVLDDFQNIAHIGLMKLFALLYRTFPGFSWFDGIHVAVSVISFVLYSWAVLYLCVKREFGFALSTAVVMVAAVLGYYNFVLSNNCREVLTLTTLLLFVFWGWNKTGKPGVFGYILLTFSFLVCTLMRFEFAAFAAVAFAGYLVFHFRSAVQRWKIFAGPMLILIFIGAFLFYDRNYSGDFAKESDFSQYLISDAQKVMVLDQFKNQQDSMRYIAATELWLSDTANLKIDFFRNLQQYKIGFSKVYFQQYFPGYVWAGWEIFSRFLKENIQFVFLVLLVAAYLLADAFFVRKNFKSRWLKILGPIAATFALLYLISFLVRMDNTVLQPMCLIVVLYLLADDHQLNAVPSQGSAASVFLKGFFFIGFAALFIAANITLYQFCSGRESALELNRAVCRETDALADGKYLMVDGTSNFIFDHRPAENYVFKKPEAVLLYDNGQLILGKPYLDYHQKICNCNALDNSSFYKFIYSNRDKVLFLSTPHRMAFVFSYLRIMHQLPYGYEQIPGNFALNAYSENDYSIRYYRLVDKPL